MPKDLLLSAKTLSSMLAAQVPRMKRERKGEREKERKREARSWVSE
jgi:hypothetical protein